ncbi:MAG: DUF1552 domain-containing protein, partial [Polyangiaceae bacterium]|nr:DUF1552 domain-containing protein [Polyangiaceae bacterium]
QDSLYFYAGINGGWLGGACISYRGPNRRRNAVSDPLSAYENMIGGSAGLSEEASVALNEQGQSVNDLVREQLRGLLRSPRLSSNDRDRLDLHLSAIRDLEVSLRCRLNESEEERLISQERELQSIQGDEVLALARQQMEVGALAIACGSTRSVVLQVGSGNDGSTEYYSADNNASMENYHYISHRRLSHDAEGRVLQNSNLLHHEIDKQFARTYQHLLDQLSSYPGASGTLLDDGLAIWLNDLGNGPAHSPKNVPWVLTGGAGGAVKTGEHLRLSAGNFEALNHAQLLNTIATSVGCTSQGLDYCNDLGDRSLPREPLSELRQES